MKTEKISFQNILDNMVRSHLFSSDCWLIEEQT